jgi:hypothetical protein
MTAATVSVFQICYDAASARRLDPLCSPYRSKRLTRFFETPAILELIAAGRHREADYFGVLSWQFKTKIPLSLAEIVRRMQGDGFRADVYTFFGRIRETHPWRLAERKHPGIARAAEVLLDRLGIASDPLLLRAPVVHQNHFICRSSLYERFAHELLAPAVEAMRDRSDRELQELLRQDAHYSDPRLPARRLRALFGRPHFCLHPFVCERLFSTWLASNPTVRVRHVWRGRFVAREKLQHEPEMRRARARS